MSLAHNPWGDTSDSYFHDVGSVDAVIALVDKIDETTQVEDPELHKRTTELFSAPREGSAPTYLALLEKLLATADAFFD